MNLQTVRYKYEDAIRRVSNWLQLGRDGINLFGNTGSKLEVWSGDQTELARVRARDAVNGDELVTKNQLQTSFAAGLSALDIDATFTGSNSYTVSIAAGRFMAHTQVYEVTGNDQVAVDANVAYNTASNEVVISSDLPLQAKIKVIVR